LFLLSLFFLFSKFTSTNILKTEIPSIIASDNSAAVKTKNIEFIASKDRMERNVRPDEIPDGFSAADPTNNGGAGGGGDPQEAKSQEKEGQRKAILDQALTPEAFARLGTIKVRALLQIHTFAVLSASKAKVINNQ
jgi:hypothetical protein